MKAPSLCLIALLAAPTCLWAQAVTKTTPPTPGPPRPDAATRIPTGFHGIVGHVYVGEAAPGFELTSADGKRIKLSSFIGERVMLCFADRRDMLTQYRGTADSLRAIGVRLVGIARASPRSLRSLAERDSLPFILLSDPTGEIASIYGSYEFATSSIRPGYVLVGRTSIVRMALLGQRLPPEDLLRIARYALAGL